MRAAPRIGRNLDPLPVQVLSRYDLAQKVELGERLYSHCISITDSDWPMERWQLQPFTGVLKLQFHDIDRVDDMRKEERPILPQKRDLRKVLRFYRRTRANATGYTVHCRAGVHRSTAVGFALLFFEYRDEAAAAEKLLEIKPLPTPNRRMVRLTDEILGSNLGDHVEALWSRARDFLEGRLEIDKDDYLEELEPDG